jgi:Cof subfamily protein (haloacid dehalogenase superfamily)
MIALIFVDVDGTLVGSSGAVSDRVWRAAALARERGIRLAICSGRPAFGTTREYARRLDAEGWHVFQNGASIVQLPGGETRSRPLPPPLVARLVERSRDRARPLELYADEEYAVELDVPRTRQHADLLGVPFVARNLDSLRAPIVRAQWLVPHDELDAVLAEPHEGLLQSHSLSPVMPDTSFVNLTLAGVDKASAVRQVADAYRIPLERAMMVGDSANDVSALRVVGTPVAMGNSEAEVLAVARYEVADVDREGLADAFALALTL